ncbi:hypothetical protein M408DRAFT_327309 [Serendipita vermifera MAFF 305830]|uniref:Uncharacterized protein n=1 Tax=Serendipita vermifera MAFF 305830 TaxID=933852 RepID=A0A0C3B512_SERVB|nr:hypothetical protein M408DRAFT_327309 [Serendipita vermifera MAFF 305830]
MQFSTLLVAFFAVSTAFALPIAEPNEEGTSLHYFERRNDDLTRWLNRHPKQQGVDRGCEQHTTTTTPAKSYWKCQYAVKDVEVQPGMTAFGRPIQVVTGVSVQESDKYPNLAKRTAQDSAKADALRKALTIRAWQ